MIAWPDEAHERNRFALSIPYLGSLIGSSSLHSKEVGLTSFPAADRPPVLIPFFTFRIMVGCGLLMLGLAWLGMLFMARGTLERQRWFLWATFCSFPLGFIATLTGWFAAEVGRQPWTIYGHVRTADAVTPFLTTPLVAVSLVIFSVVYALIFIAGATYIYRLLQRGPVHLPSFDHATTNPKRPLSVTGHSPGVHAGAPIVETGV